jgi:hypothetical protein
MSMSQPSYESADLEKLNDQDKADLRQFLANEQQRSQIQARESQAPPILLRLQSERHSSPASGNL